MIPSCKGSRFATVSSHAYTGLEYLMVLRGDQRDERTGYREGALLINEPGSAH